VIQHNSVLENEEYASRHRLDIGELTYTQVLHFGRYFSHKDGGGGRLMTYVREYMVSSDKKSGLIHVKRLFILQSHKNTRMLGQPIVNSTEDW